MTIKVTCLLNIDKEYHAIITSTLRGLGLTVVDTRPAEQSMTNSHDKDAIACEKIFNDKDIASALALSATLEEIPGVKSSVPLFTSIEESKAEKKLKWYQKPIMPVIISSLITFITVSYAVYHLIDLLDPKHQVIVTIWDMSFIILAPTVVNFLFQVQRFYSREHTT